MPYLLIIRLIVGIIAFPTTAPLVLRPQAAAETVPVPHDGDAADDPAIWVHPTDPSKSLVIGTDKKGALHYYHLDGSEAGAVSDGARPNNVDVIYGFDLNGVPTDLALAGCRAKTGMGLKLWKIDPSSATLSDVTADSQISVFSGTEPYGTCVYHSASSGKFYAFVNNKKGQQEQFELVATADGKVGGKLVRSFSLGSETEGCVADDETGLLYIAEESIGIWKFDAEPTGSSTGKLIARVGENGLVGDVEGLTLYLASGGKGYLIASSQGSSTFKVYDRTGDNPFIATIDPQAGKFGDVEETDGIAVTNVPLGSSFPHGLLVIQDGINKPTAQNFKLFRWEDVAGGQLLIDSSTPARPVNVAKK
jgi:3-phytase